MSIIALTGSFPMPPGAPAPKFKVGDRVKVEWTCEDRLNAELYGKPIRIVGFVTGATYTASHWRQPEWVYSILVESSTYGDEVCSAIEFQESELQKRSGENARFGTRADRSGTSGTNRLGTVRHRFRVFRERSGLKLAIGNFS